MHNFPHNKTQNITLVRNSFLSNTNPELKKQLRIIQTAVLQAQESLTHTRLQMRRLSQNINKMVEKKYSKAPKERPSLFPGSQNNQRLQQLYAERDQIYRQISQIKAAIKAQKPDNQQQLISQTLKKRAHYERLVLQIQKNSFQSKFLAATLEKGKKKLDIYNQSTLLKDISQNERQLQQLKRQYKALEKESHACLSEQVFRNMYQFQIKSLIEKLKQKQQADRQKEEDIKIDQRLIQKQIKQTLQNLQQRNKVEKDLAHIVSMKKKEIQKQAELNQKMQKEMRQIMNQSLKIDLQSRRYKSEKKIGAQSLDTNGNNSPKKGKFSIMLQKKINQVQKKSVQLRKNSQREETVVTIRNWYKKDINQQGNLTQGIIASDDTHNKQKIDHLKRIDFFANSKRGYIYGLQLIYEDSYCNQIMGKKMIQEESESDLKFQRKQISMENLRAIFYCVKCSNSKNKKAQNLSNNSNSNTAISFLKFQYSQKGQQMEDANQENADQTSFITVGNSQYCSCSISALKKISLQNQMIRTISLLLFPYKNSVYESSSFKNEIIDDTLSYTEFRLKSMKITLAPQKIQQKIQTIEQFDDGKPPKRSYSLSELNKSEKHSVVTKKVILRGKALKKISEDPQVDLRLQMNNRNKMV